MVAAKISLEAVFEVANRVVAQGERPTTLKVHKILGSGSYSTVTKYLKAWEESEAGQAAKEAELPDEIVLPASVSESMTNAVKVLWTAATQASAQIVEQAQAQAVLEREEAEGLAQEVMERAENAEARLSEAENRIRQLEEQRDQHIDERATLRQQLSNAQLELEREQHRSEELVTSHGVEVEQLSGQVAELKGTVSTLQGQLNDKSLALTEEVARHDDSKQQLATATAELKAARAETESVTGQLAEQKQNLAEIQEELHASQNELITELSKHDETKQKLASASAEVKAIERLLGNLELQLTEQKQATKEQSDAVTQAREELTTVKVSESALQAELKSLEASKEALKEEIKELREALDSNVANYVEQLRSTENQDNKENQDDK